MYSLIKPLLFLLSPERAHHLSMIMLDLVFSNKFFRVIFGRFFFRKKENGKPYSVLGIDFPNRVGLAAGFDKDGKYIAQLAALGFGHIEVGTVTPLPQSGNPLPRLFRLPSDGALINRMGFNNQGMEPLAERLRFLKANPATRNIVVGVNIGKNKQTENDLAVHDYMKCFRTLHEFADYFVVNVSSPNTPDLRALQEKEPLMRILDALQVENKKRPHQKPILLKIAPDLNENQLLDIADIVKTVQIAGVIATNTTIDRKGLSTDVTAVAAIGNGGLSGKPLQAKSTDIVKKLRTLLGNDYVIIGVGGIDDLASAQEKINAGANLVQLYSGFIYSGPSLVHTLSKQLN